MTAAQRMQEQLGQELITVAVPDPDSPCTSSVPLLGSGVGVSARWPRSPSPGTSDSRKIAIATSALFHIVPSTWCGSAHTEMNSQMESAVLSHRALGVLIAMSANTTQSTPRIQLLVRSGLECSHTNAEMKSHTPSSRLSQRAIPPKFFVPAKPYAMSSLLFSRRAPSGQPAPASIPRLPLARARVTGWNSNER